MLVVGDIRPIIGSRPHSSAQLCPDKLLLASDRQNLSSDCSRLPTVLPKNLILASDGKFCIGSESCETVSCEEGELVKRSREKSGASMTSLQLQLGCLAHKSRTVASAMHKPILSFLGHLCKPLPGVPEHLLLVASQLNSTPKIGSRERETQQNPEH